MHELGGRQSLQVAFNVLNEGCGGCQYESYPYKARLPVLIDGNYETWEFKSDEDVLEVIDLIIEETKQFNIEFNKDCDISDSVYTQLPFFGCRNILFSKDIQIDIQRYIYCKELNVPPYEGGYGSQPFLWVERFFIIKSALAKYEKGIIDAAKHSDNKI